MTLFLTGCVVALAAFILHQRREVRRLRQLPIGFESEIASTGEHVVFCVYCVQRFDWGGYSLAPIDTNDLIRRPRLELRHCERCARELPRRKAT